MITAKQIENGLSHKLAMVRVNFARREDFTPNVMQIDRGLTDVNENVRLAFAKRDDIIFTEDHVETGLNDNCLYVRYHFAIQRHVDLTETQINRGLLDDIQISQIFRHRFDSQLTNGQIEMLLNYICEYIDCDTYGNLITKNALENFVTNTKKLLSVDQIER